ncbi:MAG TPA: hypothetical protein VK901_06345 [Nitrospiraceae bacterium]|nr:hypothetical protein [Nitrospiraceae bacterium]
MLLIFRVLKNRFNLFALLVDGGNRAGAQSVVDGQKHQDLADFLALCFDAAQETRVVVDPIVDHDGANDEANFGGRAEVMRLAIDDTETGQLALVGEPHLQRDRALGAAKPSPNCTSTGNDRSRSS